ncbi:hypothetical protein RAG22_21680, partial [Klebsiella pneumoniae]
MATLFIADLHLQTEEPAITAGFLRFLQGEARQADALYCLLYTSPSPRDRSVSSMPSS